MTPHTETATFTSVQTATDTSVSVTDMQQAFSGVTSLSEKMQPADMEAVFGQAAVRNVQRQIASRQRPQYDPRKKKVYQLLKEAKRNEATLALEWEKIRGDETPRADTPKDRLDGNNYWTSAVALAGALIPDSVEKTAFLEADITTITAQDALKICASVQAYVESGLQSTNKEKGQARGTHGKKRQQLMNDAKENSPQQEGEENAEYKARLSVIVDTDPELMALAQVQESLSRSSQQLGAANDYLKKLEQAVRRITDGQEKVEQQRRDAQKTCSDIDGYESSDLIRHIESAFESKARQIQVLNASQAPRDDYLAADIELNLAMLEAGIFDHADFLEAVAESDEVRSCFPDVTPNLTALVKSQEGLKEEKPVLLALAPDMPAEDFKPAQAKQLFSDRAGTYRHVQNIMAGVDEKAIDFDSGHLGSELLYSTLFPKYQMEIRLGLGGSALQDNEPLGRLLAYPLPAAGIMKSIARNNKTCPAPQKTNMPHLKIFSAHLISAAVNRLEAEGTALTAERNLEYLQTGLDMILPQEVAANISYHALSADEIANDRTIELCQQAGQTIAEFYMNHASKMQALLDPKAKPADPATWDLTADETGFCDTLAASGITLKALAEATHHMGRRAFKHDQDKHTGAIRSFDKLPFPDRRAYIERGLSYAAYHPVECMFADITLNAIVDGSQPVKMVKVGGKGEYYFDILQRVVSAISLKANPELSATNSPFQRPLHMIGKTGGNPPPYYKSGISDLNLTEITDLAPATVAHTLHTQADTGVVEDYLAVAEEIGKPENLEEVALLMQQISTNMPCRKAENDNHIRSIQSAPYIDQARVG